MKVKEILDSLEKANEPTFDIDRSPATWIAKNRVKFNTWLDKTFKYNAVESNKEGCSSTVKVDSVNLFPHQKFIKDYIQFNSPYRGILLYHGLGVGKCHARDTPIMMYDGRIKKVQDVQVGDLLMGDDSTPRTVICLNQGNDDLYKIIPKNTDDFSPFIVNSDHILCLRHRYAHDKISEISMRNYINCSQEIKQVLLQYRASVDFPHVDTPNDPYQQGMSCIMQDIYMYNSEKVRLEFLAGLIDSNEYGGVVPLHNCYSLSNVDHNTLLKAKYMASSLGMSTIITNNKLLIYGKNVDKIKLRIRKPLNESFYVYDGTSTEFDVASVGKGAYYGFAVDGNHRYLLGDFTVTHNSCASIAAAELLMNHMEVVVMTPASLRNNYIGEIKKCGRRFYNTKQHWKFIPISLFKNSIDKIAKTSHITQTLLQKHKGFWLSSTDQPGNYQTLTDKDREQITVQIDEIINQRYTFINYNGLNRDKIRALTEHNINPFDNKCIVIDEIHNLISRIVNRGIIGPALYKLLMSAKNCKLILLSGTPVINYPYEIAYMINLLTGPKMEYVFTIPKANRELVENTCAKIMMIERYEVIKDKLKVAFLPNGFEYTDKKRLDMHRVEDSITIEEAIEKVMEALKKTGINVAKTYDTIEYKTLPEKEEDFNKYFVNMEESKIENKRLFSRRILGTISHYSTYSPELYPSVKTIESFEELTPFQFQVYQKSRADERKKEAKTKKPRTDNNIFKETGQVYRFYSRANCNFVFPENIKRPFPGLKEIANEVDDDDNLVAKVIEHSEESKSKQYDVLVQKALDKLATSEENYLHLDKLGNYSPKFKNIIDRCNELDGTALVYSQFRRVEGLGILALALKANGYAEFKIRKVHGEYEIDMAEEDTDKPKYIIFTGNNEETQILLKVFNSDFDNLPPKIKQKLTAQKKAAPKDWAASAQDNIRGGIIKILMITQSGAEGLSLKNVRQVHIIEPYWNHVRIDQVVGRAVRTCSHVSLPPEDRNVTVYIYNMVFSKEQLQVDFSIRAQDNSMTSDEYIYDLAKRKAKIIKMLYDTIKTSSIDCVKYSSGDLKCFSFPVNLDESHFTYPNDIDKDVFDRQYDQEVEINEWKGQVMMTKKGNFLLRPDTKEVYDYDIYLSSGKLVKIGILRLVNEQKQIVKS